MEYVVPQTSRLRNLAACLERNMHANNPLEAAYLTKIVQLLLDRGADVIFLVDVYGTTLGVVMIHGNKQNIWLLLKRGADVNLQVHDTLLHCHRHPLAMLMFNTGQISFQLNIHTLDYTLTHSTTLMSAL